RQVAPARLPRGRARPREPLGRLLQRAGGQAGQRPGPAAGDGPRPRETRRRAPFRQVKHDLIYDWNEAGDAPRRPARRIEFDDETLRDGLQSPSAVSPSVDHKLEILRLMDAMGIDTADI